MKNLRFDYSNILPFISKNEILNQKEQAIEARKKLVFKSGEGSDFTGWVDSYIRQDEVELKRIEEAAKKIINDSDVLLVIGIGGSYLGAKAVISALNKYFTKNKLEIIFVGNSLSSEYTKEVLEYLKDKDFSINVISKSGTTTEPAIAFRIFKNLLQTKYRDYYTRIYATTDQSMGALHEEALRMNYQTFKVPKNIGGRYSVLSAVGLLPIVASGIDIHELLHGVHDAYTHFVNDEYENNEALLYASIRNLLYKKGKRIEAFVAYEPKLTFLMEWLKQLFGESEGKQNKGLFPASLIYTTDLHSMGQFVQEGPRDLFETTISIDNLEKLIVEKDKDNLDELNYLAGNDLDYINKTAMKATILAHTDGGVPQLIINLEKLDGYNFGYLLYFFMFSCGVSGYLLGVNPFNQPGVEAYKKNMFALLGKPGYETLAKELKNKKIK